MTVKIFHTTGRFAGYLATECLKELSNFKHFFFLAFVLFLFFLFILHEKPSVADLLTFCLMTGGCE